MTKTNGIVSVGDSVTCNGYPGTVTRICEFSNSMVEVRVPGGTTCVDAYELTPLPKKDRVELLSDSLKKGG